jgi:hypothetical protein
VGEDLPVFTSFRTHNTFPVSASGFVKDWGTDYVRLRKLKNGYPVITFNGSDLHDFRVKILAIDSISPTLVKTLTLDAYNDGAAAFPEMVGYEQVEISIGSVTLLDSGSYSYTVDIVPTAEPGTGLPPDGAAAPSFVKRPK